MLAVNITTYNLVYLLIVALVIHHVVFIYKNWKIVKFAWKVFPLGLFLPVLPFSGQAYLSMFISLEVNPIKYLQIAAKYLGHPYGGWVGNTYIYTTTEASEIKVVLNHPQCYDKSSIYKNFEFFFKDSILLAPSNLWKPRRRHYQKSYKPNVLKSFLPTFYEQSCQLLKDISDMKPEENLLTFFNKYAFISFFHTSAGLKKELFTNTHRIGELFDLIQDELVFFMNNFVTPVSVWLRLYPGGRRAAKLTEEAEQVIGNFIKLKRKQQVNNPENLEQNNIPLLDLMMQMTDNEIYHELLLFTGAATDTTGHALAFTSTLLGMHPEIQETLYNEVISVIGNNAICHEDLLKLTYMEAVISESMRLLPVVAYIGRIIGEDIDVGTKILPKGIDFAIDIFHLHRDPRYWDDPLKFDPTRFLPENAHKIHPFSYLPFSAGPRDCIGKKQAMMVLKTTFANIMRTFRIISKYKSVEDIKLTSCITLKSSHPLECQFLPRSTK